VTFALLLRTQQRFKEAESLFREAYDAYRRAIPVNHRAVGETATHLANVLITLGRNEVAALHAREAIAQLQLAVPYDEMALAFARLELGRALLALRKYSEAEQPLLEAEQGLTKTDAFHLGILAPIALYTTWDLAEPEKGYDAKAQERISKLIGTFIRLDAQTADRKSPQSTNDANNKQNGR
jgi:tetratricopeptide (TPR) repeat protein